MYIIISNKVYDIKNTVIYNEVKCHYIIMKDEVKLTPLSKFDKIGNVIGGSDFITFEKFELIKNKNAT